MYCLVVVKNTTAHRRSYRVRDPRTDRGPLPSAETIVGHGEGLERILPTAHDALLIRLDSTDILLALSTYWTNEK
jgi:hypothetical protein